MIEELSEELRLDIENQSPRESQKTKEIASDIVDRLFKKYGAFMSDELRQKVNDFSKSNHSN